MEYSQLIFFLASALHNKGTQNFSKFYHTSIINYELNKNLLILIFSEKQKGSKTLFHPQPASLYD